MKKEKIWILGARRGLGAEILKLWKAQHPEHDVMASSRKEFSAPGVETYLCDMTRPQDVESLLQKVDHDLPNRVFYIAGGGPYGTFTDKQLKDHEWGLAVTFLTPLKLIYQCLKQDSVNQVICVGSAIAEDQADPGAASYAAAKHGLKGLICSLQQETNKDLRLFSPGYMDTEMLPRAVQGRLDPSQPVLDPHFLAKEFINWAQNPKASWHWSSRPSE